MKDKIISVVLVVLSLLPAACHALFTGPWLWNHQSSAAFEVWVFFWVLIAFGIWMAVYLARYEFKKWDNKKPLD